MITTNYCYHHHHYHYYHHYHHHHHHHYIVSQAHSASDARALVKKLIGGSKIELLKLKRSIGGAIRPLLGNPDGYYELDMAVEMDRFCIIRLLEISSTFEKTRKAASLIGPEVMGDVSQRGTWSCFRCVEYIC